VGTTAAPLRSVFLDTSALFAAASTSERRHADAAAALRSLLSGAAPLLTTDLVVAELHALAMRRAGQRNAVEITAGILSSARIDVVSVPIAGLDEAMTFLAYRLDRPYSLTDAASIVLMR
jgi:predicted nucleic acid-binding protein